MRSSLAVLSVFPVALPRAVPCLFDPVFCHLFGHLLASQILDKHPQRLGQAQYGEYSKYNSYS